MLCWWATGTTQCNAKPGGGVAERLQNCVKVRHCRKRVRPLMPCKSDHTSSTGCCCSPSLSPSFSFSLSLALSPSLQTPSGVEPTGRTQASPPKLQYPVVTTKRFSKVSFAPRGFPATTFEAQTVRDEQFTCKSSELFEQPAPGFQWLSGLRLCSARVGATVVTHGWLVESIQHQGNTSGQSTVDGAFFANILGYVTSSNRNRCSG